MHVRGLKPLTRIFSGRRLGLLGLLVGSVALVGSACGGDDNEALKIAYLADFSGPIAEFGPAIQTGVDLAIEHINAGGGVFGKDVVLVTGDTGLDAVKGVEEASRLVEIAGAHVMVGPLSSSVTIAVAEGVTSKAKVPTISPSATAPGISVANDDGYLFRSTTSDAAQGPVLAQLAADEGYTNVGVLFINDPYGQGLSGAFESAFQGTLTSSSYEAGQTTYLAELQAAAGGGATVLVAIGFPTEALVYIREALENDIFDKFLFVDGTKSPELIEGIGAEFLNGFKGTAPTGGPDTASAIAWLAAYEARFGAPPSTPFVKEAYDATIALALAAELAGSTDGEKIRDALPKVGGPSGETFIAGAAGVAAALEAVRDGKSINYEGAATSLDWDAAGDVLTGFIGLWQFADGAIVELSEVPFDLR